MLGYWLAEDHWGKGIATWAVQTVVSLACEQAHFVRIEAMVYEHNVASVRVLEKCGFTLESRNIMNVGETKLM